MLKVGLTGGIGSGKSTIAKMFMEKGVPVIDADAVSKQVLDAYPEILLTIKREFGKQFFDENNKLKRKEFGNYIFADDTLRKKLENIIIPYIKLEIKRQMKAYKDKREKICILDAPTLIENGMHKDMDVTVVVYTDKIMQLKRVMERDNLDKNEGKHRIDSQMPLEDKLKYADMVIQSCEDFEETKKNALKVLKKLIKLTE